MGKRLPAAIHSKKADHLGRTKDHRHGTRSWISWVSETREEGAYPFRHPGKRILKFAP
jgi:hypothetical protein